MCSKWHCEFWAKITIVCLTKWISNISQQFSVVIWWKSAREPPTSDVFMLKPSVFMFIYVYFSIYWEHVYPIWLSHFLEGWLNHQPDVFGWTPSVAPEATISACANGHEWQVSPRDRGESCRAKIANVRPPSDVCWFRFAPVTIVISTINHSEIGVFCTNWTLSTGGLTLYLG